MYASSARLALALALVLPTAHADEFQVNTIGDGNDGVCNARHCSLREAINASNASAVDDRITFDVSGEILLKAAPLPAITGGVVAIDANGVDITLNGRNDKAILVIAGGTVAIDNVNFTAGSAEAGGAITNRGLLTVENSSFAGNLAAATGGAILNTGDLSIRTTGFFGNAADRGAAIFNTGALNICSTGFSGGNAPHGGSAIFNAGGDIFICESSFEDNSVTEERGGAIASEGGFVNLASVEFGGNLAPRGAAIWASDAIIEARNVGFIDNTSAGNGGALFVAGTSGIFAENSLFQGNGATGGGGAIWHEGAGFLTLQASSFAANTASDGNGGAIRHSNGEAQIENVTFAGNSASGSGGALYTLGTAVVDHGTFTDNAAGAVGASVAAAEAGAIAVSNTLLARAQSGEHCAGTVTDGSGSIAESGNASACGPVTLLADPGLDPAGPRNNGGPTPTVALCTDVGSPEGCAGPSPALDLVQECSLLDQRGVTRPTTCDSGAFEAGVDLDLGDGPEGFPTLLADNGAAHVISGSFLGTLMPDAEPDGRLSADARGDDTDATDDEDAVEGSLTLVPGQTSTYTVTVANVIELTRVNVWLDRNQDGDWNDLGEQLAFDAELCDGGSCVNTFSFDVTLPVRARPGAYAARLRVCDSGDCNTPFGIASAGEVEDHVFNVEPPPVVAAPEEDVRAGSSGRSGGGGGGGGGSLDLLMLVLAGLLWRRRSRPWP